MMKPKAISGLLLFLCVCYLPAGVFQKAHLEDIVERADTIVVGQVFSKRSYWDENHRMILTDNTLFVSETLKGRRRDSVVVTSIGGEVGDQGMVNTAAETFMPGEAVLLFLVQDQRGKWQTLNMAQGKFNILRDSASRETFIQGALPGGVTKTSGQGVDGWKLSHFTKTIRNLVERRQR